MTKGIRKVALTLLFTAVLVFPFTSCTEKMPVQETPIETSTPTPTPTPTPEPVPTDSELQQILTTSALNVGNLQSLRSKMFINMNMTATGGSQPGTMTVDLAANTTQNNPSHEMHLTMNTQINVQTGEPFEQNVSAELYVLGDWVYVKTELPMVGQQWMKMALTDELRKQFDMDVAAQQLNLYKDPTAFKFLRYESINGIRTYVIEINPSKEALSEWLTQLTGQTTNIDWLNTNLADLFKKLSFITWIAKDSKLPLKMDAGILMEMSYTEVGATAEDFEKLSIGINMGIDLYDHNQTLTITLPPEAAGALEIPEAGS